MSKISAYSVKTDIPYVIYTEKQLTVPIYQESE